MPHPVNDAAFRLGVLSHAFPMHSTGSPAPPLHQLARSARVDLPASAVVGREVAAMLDSGAPLPPRPRAAWPLRHWLHARAAWLEAALRP